MSGMLVGFARTGVPAVIGVPEWAPYALPQRATMIFDVAPRLHNDPRAAERHLFEAVPYIQRGTY